MKYYFIVHTQNSVSHIISMIYKFRILIATSGIEKNIAYKSCPRLTI